MPAGLTDTDVHYPDNYSPPGTWIPGSGGFPATGASYVDPTYGTTITRITSEYPAASGACNYAKNGFWNADGTAILHYHSFVGFEVLNIPSGTVRHSITWTPDAIISTDASFDPINPDVIWCIHQHDLVSLSVSTGVFTVVKTFGFLLGSLGSSVDWIDNSGRYFVLADATNQPTYRINVWDRVTDQLFTGTLDVVITSGWVGISPLAKRIIYASSSGTLRSNPLDTAARTIGSTVTFWTLGGDHADFVDASDGKTYLVGHDHANSNIYQIDTSLAQTGLDPDQQRAQNRLVLHLPINTYIDHLSGGSRGVNRDWMFYGNESMDDTFADPGTWGAYKQEIFAIQLVSPYTVRRLAHHRSRDVSSSYYATTRVQANWDGTQLIFSSNMGANPTAGYADLWHIAIGELVARVETIPIVPINQPALLSSMVASEAGNQYFNTGEMIPIVINTADHPITIARLVQRQPSPPLVCEDNLVVCNPGLTMIPAVAPRRFNDPSGFVQVRYPNGEAEMLTIAVIHVVKAR
jgi:hypothetical protein